MAAVEVTISGVLYDKVKRTTQPVVIIGEASLTGLGVGGGPVIPPGQPGSGLPDHIWGPTDPRPNPPIAFPPGWVGGVPPGGWPIDPPNHPPERPLFEWHTAWTPEEGWIVVGVPQFPHVAPSGAAAAAAAPAPPKK